MIAWNSPLSIGFDIVFGVLPALFLGVLSLLFCFSVLKNMAYSESQAFALTWSVCGIVATYSMVHVSITRTKTKNKILFIACLALGIATAAFTTHEEAKFFSTNLFQLPVFISIVAIKHIIMLTRA
jgi:uncharacterized membrane protein